MNEPNLQAQVTALEFIHSECLKLHHILSQKFPFLPLGPFAFTPTNNKIVLFLGDGWYVETSYESALPIVQRRKLEIEAQLANTRFKLITPISTVQPILYGDGEFVDIKEEYSEKYHQPASNVQTEKASSLRTQTSSKNHIQIGDYENRILDMLNELEKFELAEDKKRKMSLSESDSMSITIEDNKEESDEDLSEDYVSDDGSDPKPLGQSDKKVSFSNDIHVGEFNSKDPPCTNILRHVRDIKNTPKKKRKSRPIVLRNQVVVNESPIDDLFDIKHIAFEYLQTKVKLSQTKESEMTSVPIDEQIKEYVMGKQSTALNENVHQNEEISHIVNETPIREDNKSISPETKSDIDNMIHDDSIQEKSKRISKFKASRKALIE